MYKKVMKKLLILFFILLAASINLAAPIDIYCPYCNNPAVEVLNNDDGICKCNECDRFMLILNGTIYTDDKRELLLEGYTIYPADTNNELENTTDTYEVAGSIQNNLDDKSTTLNDSEYRDNNRYEIEPEMDESDTKIVESQSAIKDEQSNLRNESSYDGQISSFSNTKLNEGKHDIIDIATSDENKDVDSIIDYFESIKASTSTASTIEGLHNKNMKSTLSEIGMVNKNQYQGIHYNFMIIGIVMVGLIVVWGFYGKNILKREK